MATSTHYFSGTARWAKLFKVDEKYGKYAIEVKLDEKSLEEYRKAGCQGRPSKDGEGYYSFRRDPTATVFGPNNTQSPAGAPKVVNPDGSPSSELVGNGSEVTVKVSVYDTKKFGKGTRLEVVCVDNLVKYEGKSEQGAQVNAVAAQAAASPVPSSAGDGAPVAPKPRLF